MTRKLFLVGAFCFATLLGSALSAEARNRRFSSRLIVARDAYCQPYSSYGYYPRPYSYDRYLGYSNPRYYGYPRYYGSPGYFRSYGYRAYPSYIPRRYSRNYRYAAPFRYRWMYR